MVVKYDEIQKRKNRFPIDNLIELKNELAQKVGFDPDKIVILNNSYGEYETEYDGELWSNCLSYEEAESELHILFRGIELGKGA